MRKQSFCYRSLLIVTSPAVFQVSTTTDGLDADLWKDGLFKSKVTRYLCFTRVFSKENVSKSNSAIRKMSKISHLIQFNNHLKKSSSLMFFFFSLQSHLGNVLVDMKLIDIKDTLPVGFIPIQETVDTRK